MPQDPNKIETTGDRNESAETKKSQPSQELNLVARWDGSFTHTIEVGAKKFNPNVHRFRIDDISEVIGSAAVNQKTKENLATDGVINEVRSAEDEAKVVAAGEVAEQINSDTALGVAGLNELRNFLTEMANANSVTGSETGSTRMLMVESGSAEYLVGMDQSEMQGGDQLSHSTFAPDSTNVSPQFCFIVSEADGLRARDIFKKNGHREVDLQNTGGFQAEMGGVCMVFLFDETIKDINLEEKQKESEVEADEAKDKEEEVELDEAV
ncbi:MAG: hypothetical protein UR53_C0003G0023 [Candidatus Magasanikbacteria bacterium GW2011_GWC2_34_16]|uniref:Uncharacterized protein n=2 Tax=Candidatus Magasanikiibacteriota TaxID=1752731 RepID=A0A0G0JWS5_9BACT|nr:MAG: hypothetical protein UR53_C0003G0023 [Candidatus Magasanikbacteria bacterium GW2011_GWC2_34_16]KKQ41299.1 MAG: hypothetical protein US58_C0002G0022 [Candidatus Magasanikbacteria bacterium GW2011_GWA2_37_8]